MQRTCILSVNRNKIRDHRRLVPYFSSSGFTSNLSDYPPPLPDGHLEHRELLCDSSLACGCLNRSRSLSSGEPFGLRRILTECSLPRGLMTFRAIAATRDPDRRPWSVFPPEAAENPLRALCGFLCRAAGFRRSLYYSSCLVWNIKRV